MRQKKKPTLDELAKLACCPGNALFRPLRPAGADTGEEPDDDAPEQLTVHFMEYDEKKLDRYRALLAEADAKGSAPDMDPS